MPGTDDPGTCPSRSWGLDSSGPDPSHRKIVTLRRWWTIVSNAPRGFLSHQFLLGESGENIVPTHLLPNPLTLPDLLCFYHRGGHFSPVISPLGIISSFEGGYQQLWFSGGPPNDVKGPHPCRARPIPSRPPSLSRSSTAPVTDHGPFRNPQYRIQRTSHHSYPGIWGKIYHSFIRPLPRPPFYFPSKCICVTRGQSMTPPLRVVGSFFVDLSGRHSTKSCLHQTTGIYPTGSTEPQCIFCPFITPCSNQIHFGLPDPNPFSLGKSEPADSSYGRETFTSSQ